MAGWSAADELNEWLNMHRARWRAKWSESTALERLNKWRILWAVEVEHKQYNNAIVMRRVWVKSLNHRVEPPRNSLGITTTLTCSHSIVAAVAFYCTHTPLYTVCIAPFIRWKDFAKTTTERKSLTFYALMGKEREVGFGERFLKRIFFLSFLSSSAPATSFTSALPATRNIALATIKIFMGCCEKEERKFFSHVRRGNFAFLRRFVVSCDAVRDCAVKSKELKATFPSPFRCILSHLCLLVV